MSNIDPCAPDPKWKAPPAPSVNMIAPDDVVWVAQCDIDQLTALFQDPKRWMACLSSKRPAGTPELTLAPHYVITMEPIDPQELLSADISLQEHFESLLGPPAPEALHKVVVQGISGTSVIIIRASKIVTVTTLIERPEWKTYWDEWKVADLDVTLMPDAGKCFGHIQLVKKSAPDRGNRLAAFLMCASRSVAHMNSLYKGKKPKSVKAFDQNGAAIPTGGFPDPKFKDLSLNQLAAITFLYQSADDTDEIACEIVDGTIDSMGEVTVGGSVTKLYPPLAPPPPGGGGGGGGGG